MVRKYVEVFLEDLPGLPPDSAMEFEIELIPGTGSISKASYRMTPVKLKELQV